MEEQCSKLDGNNQSLLTKLRKKEQASLCPFVMTVTPYVTTVTRV